MIAIMKQTIFSLSFVILFAHGYDFERLENNILTAKNQPDFNITAYPPPSPTEGDPKNVADEQESLDPFKWTTYGFRTKADASEIAYVQVDLKKPHIARAFAITGFPDGSFKPTGEYYLEGSNNAQNWKMVGVGKPSQWLTPGTFPFKKEQIVPAMYPDSYRYYRVIARGWTNGYMVIYNWGLFV